MVLLALVDAKYIFLWVDVRSSGSDKQIFNHDKLKTKIENGTLRPTQRMTCQP